MRLKELEIQGFKSFPDKTKIEIGEGITGVVGPNGSGKSTILKTITRYLAPLAGAVELDGREISRWKTAEFARNLAVMLTDRPRTELLTLPRCRRGGKAPLHRANGHTLARRP